jgi:hypothetical protein
MKNEKSTGQVDRIYSVVNYELPDAIVKFLEEYFGAGLEEIEKLM